MKVSESCAYIPYGGYPRDLSLETGIAPAVILDATHPAAFFRLWGLSLLERNLRLVERLGARSIHLLVRPQDQQRARKRRFPGERTPVLHLVADHPGAAACELAGRLGEPALLLEARTLYDRRFIAALWRQRRPAAGLDHGRPLEAPALMLDPEALSVLSPPPEGGWEEMIAEGVRRKVLQGVDLALIEERVSLLRKSVPPAVIRVAAAADLKRADAQLRMLAGKGVNDLIGEFVHPPIEFFLTRVAAATRVTPNQLSWVIVVLSAAGLYLFAAGRLWEGIALNLVRGVLDGVDGKLARLTLRESKGGNVLDHLTDTLYMPLLFLALGWSLSQGELFSAPALAAGVLQIAYWFNRVFSSWFRLFLEVDEGEFRPLDRLVRRLQPKRNISILLLLLSMLFHAPTLGFYAITALTVLFLLYRIVRLDQEGRRLQRRRAARSTAPEFAALQG